MWRLKNRYLLMSKTTNKSNSSVSFLCGNGMLHGTVKTKLSSTTGSGTVFSIRRVYCGTNVKPFTPLKVLLKLAIRNVVLNENKNILSLEFEDAGMLHFPVVWLRDNCQCPDCFDTVSSSRIFDQQLLRANHLPKTLSLSENSLSITWDDQHVSKFCKEWLCSHSFNEYHQQERLCEENIPRIMWDARDFYGSQEVLKKLSFFDVLNDDHILLQWLQHIARYGVSILTGTPIQSGQLEKIAERIAFVRKTHYGEQFSVIGSDDAKNVAYKKGALQLHTDLPYYNYMPGIVMLHCVKPSSEGGENILSDGLNVASKLPERMFQVLAETNVDWVDIGSHENKKFHSLNREPVLCLNRFGSLEKINWSQPQRGSAFNVSIKRAIEWYDAAIEFSRIMHDRSNAVMIKSDVGDIIAFDNRRILHGRKNYSDSNRLLYGAYIDWDEIHSRIHVLKKQLQS